MVDILSSLRTMWSPGSSVHGLSRPPPRPVSLALPLRPRRPRSSADLARVIEREIIPRLMLAHGAAGEPLAPPLGSVSARVLEAFAPMTLAAEADALTDYVETLMQAGLSLEAAYVDLLIPTARWLGDGWNEDLISFSDVTVGLSRLQQVVRNLGRRFPANEPEAGAPAACFVPAPGEQHTFGLFILEDSFRRSGWRTWLDISASEEEAAEAVADDWFDVFGMSATSDVEAGVLASAIARVRAESRNPGLFVMVGGRVFLEQPGLAEAVGADALAETAASALSAATNAIRPPAVI